MNDVLGTALFLALLAAVTQGLDVNPRGTVRRDIADAYAAAHQETP